MIAEAVAQKLSVQTAVIHSGTRSTRDACVIEFKGCLAKQRPQFEPAAAAIPECSGC